MYKISFIVLAISLILFFSQVQFGETASGALCDIACDVLEGSAEYVCCDLSNDDATCIEESLFIDYEDCGTLGAECCGSPSMVSYIIGGVLLLCILLCICGCIWQCMCSG